MKLNKIKYILEHISLCSFYFAYMCSKVLFVYGTMVITQKKIFTYYKVNSNP